MVDSLAIELGYLNSLHTPAAVAGLCTKTACAATQPSLYSGIGESLRSCKVLMSHYTS